VLVSVDRTLWNRIGLNRWTYVRALRRAGVRPLLIDFTTFTPGQPAAEWLAAHDGLVLTGGGDVAADRYGGEPSVTRDVSTARDAFELALLAEAERRNLPVLGLCRGAQLINVFKGGTLGDFRADSERYGRHHRVTPGHPVSIEADSRLADIYATTRLERVTTWHGQYVDRPGAGVEITAVAPDGTPEAIEVDAARGFGMIGVQWHAEVPPWDGVQQRLFDAFGAAVGATAPMPAPAN